MKSAAGPAPAQLLDQQAEHAAEQRTITHQTRLPLAEQRADVESGGDDETAGRGLHVVELRQPIAVFSIGRSGRLGEAGPCALAEGQDDAAARKAGVALGCLRHPR